MARTWLHVSLTFPTPILTDFLAGIWQSKDHAIEGGRGPWHQEARRLVSEYKWIHFQRGWLWIDTDVADWQIIYTEDVEKAEGAPQEAIVRARGVDP